MLKMGQRPFFSSWYGLKLQSYNTTYTWTLTKILRMRRFMQSVAARERTQAYWTVFSICILLCTKSFPVWSWFCLKDATWCRELKGDRAWVPDCRILFSASENLSLSSSPVCRQQLRCCMATFNAQHVFDRLRCCTFRARWPTDHCCTVGFGAVWL